MKFVEWFSDLSRECVLFVFPRSLKYNNVEKFLYSYLPPDTIIIRLEDTTSYDDIEKRIFITTWGVTEEQIKTLPEHTKIFTLGIMKDIEYNWSFYDNSDNKSLYDDVISNYGSKQMVITLGDTSELEDKFDAEVYVTNVVPPEQPVDILHVLNIDKLKCILHVLDKCLNSRGLDIHIHHDMNNDNLYNEVIEADEIYSKLYSKSKKLNVLDFT